MRGSLAATLVATLSLALALDAQSGAPLPDAKLFLAKARERLVSNELLQSRYTFKERTREHKFNPLGHMGAGAMLLYEVFPSVDPNMTYRRLIERDGKPIPAAELEAQDNAYRQRYHEWQRQLARESAGDSAARSRRLAEEERKQREQAAEIIALFDFTLDRRDSWEREPAVVVRFRPRPDARPRSREARVASVFAGQAWIQEHEYEVMHLEADTIDDVAFGFGIVARLHQGAKTSLTRRRTNRVWLPSETRFAGTGRAFMLRKVTIDYVREYSDYRPYDPRNPPPIPGLAPPGNR